MTKMSSRGEPWYGSGLRFRCRRCGACCTGEPGYVFLARGEAAVIASHLGITVNIFRERCTRRADARTSLTEETDGRCVFFRGERCLIYPVRPVQCRTFPFWEWNVGSRENWEQTARDCPGMEGGRLFTLEEIEELLAARQG